MDILHWYLYMARKKNHEKDISYWKRMRAGVKKMKCYGYTTLVHGQKKNLCKRYLCWKRRKGHA